MGWKTTLLVMLPNVIVAILVMLAFYFGARLVKRLLRKLLRRFSQNELVTSFLSNVVFVTISTVGFLTALGALHLEKAVTSLLAGAGILGLAIGFAFQDIVANFISGVLIAFYKPFEVRHKIKSKEFTGEVVAITLRHTLLDMPTGERVIIPNKDIVQNPLINYSVGHVTKGVLGLKVARDFPAENLEEECRKLLANFPELSPTKAIEVNFKRVGKEHLHFDMHYTFRSPGGRGADAIKNRFFYEARAKLEPAGILVG